MSFSEFKRVIEEDDTVILYVGLTNLYAIEVKPTIRNRHGVMVEYTFQTKYGALRVMDLVGKEYGSEIQLTKGYAHALYPTPELWTLTLPHRTQILYTPDISLIITELEIRPGSIVCEAGTGSGSLSHSILRAIGPKGHLYTYDFHQERVDVARKEFERHGHSSRVTVEARDVCTDGWGRTNVANAVFLDLPKPWETLDQAVDAIHPNGGRICSFSPCVEQVSRSCEVMRNLGLTEINTVECLQRELQYKSIVLPSVNFRKVDDPMFESTGAKVFEPSFKKKKFNNETKEEEKKNSLEDVELGNTETQTNLIVNEKLVPVNNIEESIAEQKMRIAIPLLKMQGHTGFLTFATVSPRLKLRRKNRTIPSISTVADTESTIKLNPETNLSQSIEDKKLITTETVNSSNVLVK